MILLNNMNENFVIQTDLQLIDTMYQKIIMPASSPL